MNKIAPKAGVVGFPISQSLSPSIHREWMRRENKTGSYNPILIGDNKDEFFKKIRELQKSAYAGINVTLPHKQNAYAYADHYTDEAKLAGAANMLTFKKDGVYADNSDHIGFQNALKNELSKTQTSTDNLRIALLLGAGGASGAVLIALIKFGFSKIYICNRSSKKANLLKQRLEKITHKDQILEVIPWEERDRINANLVVNTTSLGMSGNPPLNFVINKERGHKIIADIVYSPLETPLLKQAKLKGLITIDGLSMLMHQAVPGYKQWLGEEAVVDDALRQLLIHRLKDKPAMKIIGLTGSIGMGKSTVGAMFKDFGCALWDADNAVHRLYSKGGAGVNLVGAAFPSALENGQINRDALSLCLKKEPEKFKLLEEIVHPLVANDRQVFLEQQRLLGTKIAVLDIPLLFENEYEKELDGIIVVSAPKAKQKERVLARAGMSEEKFNLILSKQLPDIDKRERADYIIDTGQPLKKTRADVARVFEKLKH